MTRKPRTTPQPGTGPMTPSQMIERLTQMNNNLAMQVEEFTAGRMTESMSDLDWANRVDRDYLWIRTSGANAPQFRYMTKETIDMYADIANFMYVYNPLINRIVTVKTSFTFAMDYSITAKDPESDIGTQIDAIMEDKLNRQAVFTHKAITEIDSELLRTGNVFIAVWKDNIPVNISAWSNYEIRQVVTDKNNANRPLFYIRQWLDDEGKEHTKAYPSMFATDKDIPAGKMKLTYLGTTYDIDRSVVVYHVCGKKPLKSKFALTELVAPCRWAKPHEKFLEDFGAIVTAIRKYTSMMITKGGTGQVSAISAQMKGDTNYMGTPLQSKPAGSMIVAQEGNEYKVVDAGSGKIVGPEDSRYFLLMVSAASGVPETYLTMDPSTGNLATAKEISPIFITQIQERQTAWKEAFTDIFEYILESDEFEVSFPPIRDNMQAYVTAVNAFARDAQGNWTGALRGEDYVKAAHEALEWKLPPDEEVEAMGAALEEEPVPQEPPGMDTGLDAIAQAATELKEATRWLQEGGPGSGRYPAGSGGEKPSGGGGGDGASSKGSAGVVKISNDEYRALHEGTGEAFAEHAEESLGEEVTTFGGLAESDNSVSWYTGDGYPEINNELRHPGGASQNLTYEETGKSVSDHISQLDNVIARAPPLPKGTVLYRGLGDKSGKALASAQVGDICSDPGFQSHSLNPSTAEDFSKVWHSGGDNINHQTVIRAIANGSQKAIYTDANSEKEAIIGRGTKWKLVGKDEYKVTGRATIMHILTVVPV